MSRFLKILVVAVTLSAGLTTPVPSLACPMCQVANEDDTNKAAMARPRAYMYSILFMLAMPATIFTAFGVSFYQLSKKRGKLDEDAIAGMHSD